MKEKLRKAHVTDCVNVTNIKHKPSSLHCYYSHYSSESCDTEPIRTCLHHCSIPTHQYMDHQSWNHKYNTKVTITRRVMIDM